MTTAPLALFIKVRSSHYILLPLESLYHNKFDQSVTPAERYSLLFRQSTQLQKTIK